MRLFVVERAQRNYLTGKKEKKEEGAEENYSRPGYGILKRTHCRYTRVPRENASRHSPLLAYIELLALKGFALCGVLSTAGSIYFYVEAYVFFVLPFTDGV